MDVVVLMKAMEQVMVIRWENFVWGFTKKQDDI